MNNLSANKGKMLNFEDIESELANLEYDAEHCGDEEDYWRIMGAIYALEWILGLNKKARPLD